MQLDYGRQPRKGRRWLRRVALLLTLLVLAAIVEHFYGDAYRKRAVILQYQRSCMTWSGDPAKPVFTRNPALKPVQARPTCWTDFLRAEGYYVQDVQAVYFLHERRTPAGKRRLIALSDSPHAPWWDDAFPVLEVHEPAGWMHQSKCLWTTALTTDLALYTGTAGAHTYSDRSSTAFTIYAGQADPENQSHFTVRFVSPDGKPHLLDANLKDDDSVEVKTIDLPAP